MQFRCEWVTGTAVQQALDIRRHVYIEEFGFDLGGGGPADEFDARAYQLVVTTEAGDPAASLRLLDNRARPFEIERFIDLAPHLARDWRPAEITRLCIMAPYRRITQSSFIHLVLLEAVLQLAGRLGITHVVASTRQELMGFYKYLLFEPYPDVTYEHPEIGDALHTLMILDLAGLLERCRLQRPTLFPVVRDALQPSRTT